MKPPKVSDFIVKKNQVRGYSPIEMQNRSRNVSPNDSMVSSRGLASNRNQNRSKSPNNYPEYQSFIPLYYFLTLIDKQAQFLVLNSKCIQCHPPQEVKGITYSLVNPSSTMLKGGRVKRIAPYETIKTITLKATQSHKTILTKQMHTTIKVTVLKSKS